MRRNGSKAEISDTFVGSSSLSGLTAVGTWSESEWDDGSLMVPRVHRKHTIRVLHDRFV